MSALQTTNKDEIAEYLFERTVIDLALAGREILNKVITKRYHEADLTTLATIATALQRYTAVATGQADPKEAFPMFLTDSFVKFTEKFNAPSKEPMIQEAP